jgi:hypothetical protein
VRRAAAHGCVFTDDSGIEEERAGGGPGPTGWRTGSGSGQKLSIRVLSADGATMLDETPVFTQTKYSNIKFDFTPPVSLLDKLDDKLDFSRTPANEEKQNEGGTSP